MFEFGLGGGTGTDRREGETEVEEFAVGFEGVADTGLPVVALAGESAGVTSAPALATPLSPASPVQLSTTFSSLTVHQLSTRGTSSIV